MTPPTVTEPTGLGAGGHAASPPSAARQFRSLVGALWQSPSRAPIAALGVGVVVIIVATALAQVRLNAWNRPFYDAVERKDVAEFLRQLLVFGVIVAVLLVLNVAQRWLHQTLLLRLREWMTRDLIAQWLKGKRAFEIARVPEVGQNPDQRIHQDGERLTTLATDLGIGLFQSALLLVSFVGVLWALSSGIVLSVGGERFSVPGYMVWCALLYSAVGSSLSWRVGRPLVGLNARRYEREADLRAGLVQTGERIDAITLYGQAPHEQQRLEGLLAAVLASVRGIISASVRLTWVTGGYGWLALVVPIIVASPGYFGGALSFGELMMVVGAFYQVQQALRWFVDQVGAIADFRATLLRVTTFRDALLELDEKPMGEHIERALDPDGHLRFEGLVVTTPGGPTRLAEGDVTIAPGERVLIVGGPGTGKTALFLAIAGLWSQGQGRIFLPPPHTIAFLSQRPYVPHGTLRDALTPSPARAPSDSRLVELLTRVGLAHLAPALDRVERWDRELTLGELQRLSYARLLLLEPRWVISDDGLDALLAEEGAAGATGGIRSVFDAELSGATVVSFAARSSAAGFYTRRLHLVGPGHAHRKSAAAPIPTP